MEGAVPGLVGHMCPDFGASLFPAPRATARPGAAPKRFLNKIDEFELNEMLWRAVKGKDAPVPPAVRRAIAFWPK